MKTPILHVLAPVIAALLGVLAIKILLQGHNAPGGGFIGGLIGAAAVMMMGFLASSATIRARLRIDPLQVAGLGVFLAVLSGLLSWGRGMSYLSGLWWYPFGKDGTALSTPLLFDIGVWLVVASVVAAVALALEQARDDEGHGDDEGARTE